ncbi:Protein CBG04912 [Caenorhabditis briggsae]|uniref:Protein CBG04912 n=1 Tax=Caenorhabditis briggsae TaxID=6238 RepID=A8WYS7_CAEBR|nr:Protein CBG04912 [Caenorhabditis briggsae]CAP25535.2 Protein CBG04912 [Caenorhabditis briggsae]
MTVHFKVVSETQKNFRYNEHRELRAMQELGNRYPPSIFLLKKRRIFREEPVEPLVSPPRSNNSNDGLQENFEIDESNLEMYKVIETGSFYKGKLSLAFLRSKRDETDTLAVIVQSAHIANDNIALSLLKMAVKTMSGFPTHPNILAYLGFVRNECNDETGILPPCRCGFVCKFSTKADLGDFAVCMHEIFSLGKTSDEAMSNGKFLAQPAFCHNEIYHLMQHCWNADSEQNRTFSYCITFLEQHMKKFDVPIEHQIEMKLLDAAREQRKLLEFVDYCRKSVKS